MSDFTFLQLPIGDIDFDTQNVRSDYRTKYSDGDSSDIESLAASIAEVGLIEPIIVEKVGERYRLISGERRLRAFQFHNEKNPSQQLLEITAKVYDVIDDGKRRLIQLVENLQRKDLGDYDRIVAVVEQLESVKQRIDPDTNKPYSLRKFSSIVGISTTLLSFYSHIAKRPVLIDNVMKGILTASGACQLLPFDDADIEVLVSKLMSARQAGDPERRVTNADIRELEQLVTSRPVKVDFTDPFVTSTQASTEHEVVLTVTENTTPQSLNATPTPTLAPVQVLAKKFGNDFFGSVNEEPEVYRVSSDILPSGMSAIGSAFAQGLKIDVGFQAGLGAQSFLISADKARLILSKFAVDTTDLNDTQVFDRLSGILG